MTIAVDRSDDEHIRYMLDGGTRGRIAGLVETRDAWGFGGMLWISKASAHYKWGPGDSAVGRIFPLRFETRFCKQWFELDTGAKGWSVWFRAPELPLGGRSLCGWVPAEREHDLATWIAFLNDEIDKRVEEHRPVPVDADAAKARRTFEQSIAFFRNVGAHVPEANNVDELVTRLEAASSDGPIDLRSESRLEEHDEADEAAAHPGASPNSAEAYDEKFSIVHRDRVGSGTRRNEMKVRYRMLGDVAFAARLVEAPSHLFRSATDHVLEIDAGAPIQISPPGADVEVVEATDAEWKALESAGYACKRALADTIKQ